MKWKAPALFLALSAVVLVLLWYVSEKEEASMKPALTPLEPVILAVAADPHFLAPSLTDHGAYFNHVITHGDGKVTQYIDELTRAFFAQIEAERPDALILAGDLTFNGARESHEAFAARCAALQASGVQVLVLPGNHDLDNPQATRFLGDTFEPAERLSPASMPPSAMTGR